MKEYTEIAVSDIFDTANGHPRYIRDYIDRHPGDYPVYSASLTKPFGYIDSYDYDGYFLTWLLNGYGGRVQEIKGKFSANRDRGVLIPRADVETPDLTYLRYALEPELVAAAVGRRVDGKKNEYVKIYPETAKRVTIRIPVNKRGEFDYDEMRRIGAKLRDIELAQHEVREALSNILAARITIEAL